MMVHAALKTEQTRQAAYCFGHMVRRNSYCHHGAPAHLLLLHEQLKEYGLVPLVLALPDALLAAILCGTLSGYRWPSAARAVKLLAL